MARSTRGTTPSNAWPRAGLRIGLDGRAIACGRVSGCLRCLLEERGREGDLRARSAWLDADSGRAIDAPVMLAHEPLTDLRRLIESTRASATRVESSGGSNGGWLGWISYDYGRMLEPRAQSARSDGASRLAMHGEAGASANVAWPLMEVMRVEGLMHRSASEMPGQRAEHGDGQASWRLDKFHSVMGHEQYVRAVRRAIEYIHAGDVYQVNLSHEFRGEFRGRPRDLLLDLWASADPRFGGWFFSPPDEAGGTRVIVSASPELFLAYRARDRAILTRPMKGTRRAGERNNTTSDGTSDARARVRELDASSKDRAELAMIIDLMRNDLGRVASIGSVRVSDARRIETHGTGDAALLQAIGEVTATLRDGRDVVDLLRATFPPGSVTGAPKVRAMQIIDELEVSPRGPYCGTMFLIDDAGDAWFNVMIRTARLEMPSPQAAAGGVPGTLLYSVGAGIVADSDPASEWAETEDKAAILMAAFPHAEGSKGLAR